VKIWRGVQQSCGVLIVKNQIGDQKLKEVPHSETLSAMCGRDARSVSEEKGNAAIYTQVLRLAPNHWALATIQHPRGGKIMTSKRRQKFALFGATP
jgi:hypothetical protein